MEKEQFAAFILRIQRYIKRQNFNGAYGYLKKNIINKIDEEAQIELAKEIQN